MNLDPEQVKAWQRTLAAAGFYTGAIDGGFGPLTQAATIAYAAAPAAPPAPEPPVDVPPTTGGTVDYNSEGFIKTLHPMVQQPFRDLLNAINAQVTPLFGVTGRWIQGYRNKEQQNAEVAAGFSHAPWPTSAHNGGGGTVGFACDLGWFDHSGKYVENEAATALAVKIDRASGFHSGADFGDPDHHCKRPPSMDGLGESTFIREMIHRVQNGIPLWP